MTNAEIEKRLKRIDQRLQRIAEWHACVLCCPFKWTETMERNWRKRAAEGKPFSITAVKNHDDRTRLIAEEDTLKAELQRRRVADANANRPSTGESKTD